MLLLWVSMEFVHSQKAIHSVFQHVVDTYASETNKTAATWAEFSSADLPFKPHDKSATVEEIMRHEILSERRFFQEFLGRDEPEVGTVSSESLIQHFLQLATPRIPWLASLTEERWLEIRPFFEEERERIWIFWRRVLHSAHHRTQLTVYLRLLDKKVLSIYGPTADTKLR